MIDWLVPKAHALEEGTFGFLNPDTGTSAPSLAALAGNIIDIVLLIAGVLAIGYLIYSGILYITAAGNPDSAKKGQQGVINAIIGIIIIVLAYFIAGFAMNLAGTVSS